MKGLTKKQQDVLNLIKKYMSKHGYQPSIREMATELGIASAAAHQRLIAIEKKGLIILGKARGIIIKDR